MYTMLIKRGNKPHDESELVEYPYNVHRMRVWMEYGYRLTRITEWTDLQTNGTRLVPLFEKD